MTRTGSSAGAEAAADLPAPGFGPWLPWVALPLVVGAMAPDGLSAALAWLLIPVLLALALATARGFGPLPPCRLAPRLLLGLASAIVGMQLAAPSPAAVAAILPAEGRLVRLSGDVVNRSASPWGQNLVVEWPATTGAWEPPRRIHVRAPSAPVVVAGDRIEAAGVATADGRGWSVRATELTLVQDRRDGPRGAAFRALEPLGGRQELAESLLLGRGNPPERETFRDAGLLHVLAVSGAHLAIAAALTAWLLMATGVPWAWRLGILALAALGYTWLTGASPATMRALAMALALTAAAACARRPHPLGPVALAALALVLIDPAMARDLGFILSLAAVVGICTLGLDLIRLRSRHIPLQPWPLDRPSWRALLWLARVGCDASLMGIAAGLATAPILALIGAQIAPWGWIATLAATPPCTLALWTGLPLIGLAAWWPAGPWEGLYVLLSWSLDLLVAAAELGSLPPLRAERINVPDAWLLLIWPLLFLPLRSRIELAVRIVAIALALLAW